MSFLFILTLAKAIEILCTQRKSAIFFFFLEEKKVGNLNCLNTFLLHIDLFLLIGKSQKIVYFILTTQLYHGPPN